MGTFQLALAVASLIIPVVMYFRLPIDRDRSLFIVPLVPMALLTYPLIRNAAYWFQTASRRDFFLRAGSGGIWARFPQQRRWFLPGYRVQEMTIPWEEIRSVSTAVLVSSLIRIDSDVVMDKIDNEMVPISTYHFVESRRTILDNLLKWKATEIDRGGKWFSEEAQREETTSETAEPNDYSGKGRQQVVSSSCEVVLTKSSWLRRVFQVVTPEGTFTVEWNGRRTGSDAFPVLVNGKTQELPVSRSEHGRRYEFRLRKVTGFIDVRTSLWMTLRSVKVWIGEGLLYSEG